MAPAMRGGRLEAKKKGLPTPDEGLFLPDGTDIEPTVSFGRFAHASSSDPIYLQMRSLYATMTIKSSAQVEVRLDEDGVSARHL